MTLESRSAARRLVLTGLVLWAVAAAAYLGLRTIFGDRPVTVHVRWAPSVDEPTRQRLERRYHLTQPEPREGRTFGYALTNLSTDNVRSLILDPAVEDTHHLHRTAFRAGYFAPRLDFVTPTPAIPSGLEFLTIAGVLGGLASIVLALVGTAVPALARRPVLAARQAFLDPLATSRNLARRLVSWTAQRIPLASAEASALFRVVFGSALVWLVFRQPVALDAATNPSNVLSPLHALMLRPLAAPWVTAWLGAWVATSGTLFIIGCFARTSFAALSGGVLVWATLRTANTTYHEVCALLLALLALQGARWSDAWSVDAWRRGIQSPPLGTSREYGYVMWAPSLALGIAYAAAALAKLRDGGLDWILNGTVKYHFLSDADQAMVDWGLAVGQHPWLAVVLSFGAIAIESLVIVGVVARAYRYRLLAGAASLGLVSGFVLLQGLFWPAWWILLLSFLPWHLVKSDRVVRTAQRDGIPVLAVALALAIAGQQVVVSWLRLEGSPIFSTYDMYSTTYTSPAEYEFKADQTYWMVGLDRAEQAVRCRVSRGEADLIVRERREGRRTVTDQLLHRCFPASMTIHSVFVEASRTQIDWVGWRPLDEPIRTRLTDPISIVVPAS